jgi:hypothetical protein
LLIAPMCFARAGHFIKSATLRLRLRLHHEEKCP